MLLQPWWSWGKQFVESGISKMDKDLLPELRSLIGEETIPRVLQFSCGSLLR